LAALGSTGSSSGTIAASRSSEAQTGETCIVTTDLWNENPLDNWEETDRP